VAALVAAFLVAAGCVKAQTTASPAAQGTGSPQPMSSQPMLPVEGSFPSLEGATAWVNSPPLTPKALHGKVVVVEFLTYTCINWLRTLPYVRAWSQKYRDHGLVVIGVHAPEFPFEHDLTNVRREMRELDVPFPVAVDNDFTIWRAFDNEYWPAQYFIDAQGRIRHHQFGEGDYAHSEAIIRQLLTEAGYSGFDASPAPVTATGIQAPADWADLQTGETYLGYGQAEGFASPGEAVFDRGHAYTLPASLTVNHWALAGDWTIRKGLAAVDRAGGHIAFRFHARDVHLVMGPATHGAAIRFRVTLDGQPPLDTHGGDIDAQGLGTVHEQRLYQLIRQKGAIGDRTFDIEFLDAGVEAYVFTFG
jgi:thiol-disulfide isomerase/thioredoxin